MNELVKSFGYDKYYTSVNVGRSLGISITHRYDAIAYFVLWHYSLDFRFYP